MAVNYKDGNGLIRVRKGTGAGTGGDPDIIEYLETNSAAILAAVQAIETAVEILDNIVAGSEAQVDIVSSPTITVQGTVTASGPLTDTQLRATAVPVSLSADEDVIGLVGASDIVVTINPTTVAEAHTAGDLVFDSTEIANAVRVAAGTAIIQSITILDKGDQGAALTLLVANAVTDFGALGGLPDPDDTEAATVVGWIPVAASDYVDLGASKVACVRNIGLLCKAAAASTSLWLAAFTSGTPTPASNADLVVQVSLLRS